MDCFKDVIANFIYIPECYKEKLKALNIENNYENNYSEYTCTHVPCSMTL